MKGNNWKGGKQNVNKQDKKNGNEKIKRTEEGYKKQGKQNWFWAERHRGGKIRYGEEKELKLEMEKRKGGGGAEKKKGTQFRPRMEKR